MKFVEINIDNYPDVAAIYQIGLDTGIASFETKAPEWEIWDAAHLDFSRIAAMEESRMLGWAALSPVSSRCVYGGVAEVSVYIDNSAIGRGVGTSLLKELIIRSEANNIWTLQSGIFPVNKGSIALHLKCGFRKIGFKEKIGQRGGVWFDNVLMERRSTVIGV